MPESITKPIGQFSLPNLERNYLFAGAIREDNNFWYGEIMESNCYPDSLSKRNDCIKTSVFTGEIQFFLGSTKQKYQYDGYELTKLVQNADWMVVTDLEIPPEYYTIYTQKDDILHEFENMIKNLDAKGTMEGKFKVALASEITGKNMSLDRPLYTMTRKK